MVLYSQSSSLSYNPSKENQDEEAINDPIKEDVEAQDSKITEKQDTEGPQTYNGIKYDLCFIESGQSRTGSFVRYYLYDLETNIRWEIEEGKNKGRKFGPYIKKSYYVGDLQTIFSNDTIGTYSLENGVYYKLNIYGERIKDDHGKDETLELASISKAVEYLKKADPDQMESNNVTYDDIQYDFALFEVYNNTREWYEISMLFDVDTNLCWVITKIDRYIDPATGKKEAMDSSIKCYYEGDLLGDLFIYSSENNKLVQRLRYVENKYKYFRIDKNGKEKSIENGYERDEYLRPSDLLSAVSLLKQIEKEQ